MNKYIYLIIALMSLIACKAFSQSPVSFYIAGYATLNGGTTGGSVGDTVTAATLAELNTYLTSVTPYVVLVPNTISGGADGSNINVNSNKTLLGIGASGFLDGVGLNISSKRNIIIRNLKFTMSNVTT